MSEDIEEVESNFEEILDCEGESISVAPIMDQQVNCISRYANFVTTKRPKKQYMYGKYSEEINNVADYIEGRKHRAPKTVISTTRSEYAANKPIVRCIVEETEKNCPI